jgi:hypothetical protein
MNESRQLNPIFKRPPGEVARESLAVANRVIADHLKQLEIVRKSRGLSAPTESKRSSLDTSSS